MNIELRNKVDSGTPRGLTHPSQKNMNTEENQPAAVPSAGQGDM